MFDLSSTDLIDLFGFSFLVLSTLLGAWQGATRIILSVFKYGACAWASTRGYKQLTSFFFGTAAVLEPHSWCSASLIFSWSLIFIVSLIVLSLCMRKIDKSLALLLPNFANRCFGMILGLLGGLVAMIVPCYLVAVIEAQSPSKTKILQLPDKLKSKHLQRILEKGIQALHFGLPTNARTLLYDYIEGKQHNLEQGYDLESQLSLKRAKPAINSAGLKAILDQLPYDLVDNLLYKEQLILLDQNSSRQELLEALESVLETYRQYNLNLPAQMRPQDEDILRVESLIQQQLSLLQQEIK